MKTTQPTIATSSSSLLVIFLQLSCGPHGESGTDNLSNPLTGSSEGSLTSAATSSEPLGTETTVSTVDSNSSTEAIPTTSHESATTMADETTSDPAGDVSTGGDSSSGGQSCEDFDDAPDTESFALFAPDQRCPSLDVKQFTGTINGSSDTDWFRYHVKEESDGCSLGGGSHQVVALGELRICAYIDCDAGDPPPSVFCNDFSAQFDQSPDGRPGCCNLGNVSMQVDCQRQETIDSTIYIRVDSPDIDACVEYSVEYTWN